VGNLLVLYVLAPASLALVSAPRSDSASLPVEQPISHELDGRGSAGVWHETTRVVQTSLHMSEGVSLIQKNTGLTHVDALRSDTAPLPVSQYMHNELESRDSENELEGRASEKSQQETKQGRTDVKESVLTSAGLFCTNAENNRAMKAHALAREGVEVFEMCIMGITKFGWACGLTAASMVTLVLCVPLILALSRRRPPGVSFWSTCLGSKPPPQFRPPQSTLDDLHAMQQQLLAAHLQNEQKYAAMDSTPLSVPDPMCAQSPSQALLTQAMPNPPAATSESKPITGGA